MVKKIKFAENLRNLRRSMDMTQKQLAGVLEVDQRTVSAWERGVCEPSFALLAKICEFFGETFDEILT
ncbi:MAG: helix-turn-helix transcriptional regulator [Clostridia bacterium]|nr:helix-turn-helix transcriptional regulator [Clostridia bacterium]